jgi:two-component system, sensor histidine kinase and response regulator
VVVDRSIQHRKAMEKILIIEDEPQVRSNIQEILTLSDFETISAPDGAEGVHLARNCAPDLIICDVMMPELDGYGVLNQLRQHEATAHIPLIFLTAKSERANLRQGMESGAADYLTKPFSPTDLLKAVAAQLARQSFSNRAAQAKLEQLRSSINLALPHELGTPLNGILGMSTLLIEGKGELSAPETLEIAYSIQDSAFRLYRLTQNFLLYADLELIASNPKRMQALRQGQGRCFSRSTITEIVHQKAQEFKRVTDLRVEVHNAPLSIGEDKLKKAVEEVIDNAFKFSEVGTPVDVRGDFDGKTFTLAVTNYGRGMTASQIADLGAYLQFNRAVYAQQGTGLGLILAKRLVELHGGLFTISSVPEQQTTVEITFER